MCSATDSRLLHSRKWRWNLKHLHPPYGEPAQFKVSYTSESSLFIITRRTNSGCQRWAEKSTPWIKTWWLARLSGTPGNYYLINRAFFMFVPPLTACDHIISFTEITVPVNCSSIPDMSPQKQCCFFIFDWKTMRQIKRKQMAGQHSVPLCSQGTEDANTRGFNQLERKMSGSVLHSQSPHVSALLHICSPI